MLQPHSRVVATKECVAHKHLLFDPLQENVANSSSGSVGLGT